MIKFLKEKKKVNLFQVLGKIQIIMMIYLIDKFDLYVVNFIIYLYKYKI